MVLFHAFYGDFLSYEGKRLRSLKSLLRSLHPILPVNVRHQIDIASISLQDKLHDWHMPAYYVRFPLIGKERVEHYNDNRLIATPSSVSLRLKFIECNQLSCVAAFMCFLSQKLFTD